MNEIRITDLARPEFTEFQRSAREFGDTLTVDFNRDEILAEASAEFGLSDFGPDEFLERLDLLCLDWSSDTNLNGLGQMMLRSQLVDYARTRLLVMDYLKHHPDVHDIEIRQPIIVVGLPRTGTTHLVNLLAADSRMRSLPCWEAREPLPRPDDEPLPDGTDPRYQRGAQAWEMMVQAGPLIAAMHDMAPDTIDEEISLMYPDFSTYSFEWNSFAPRFRDHYFATDQLPRYEFLKTMLKLLLHRQPPEAPTRWVLKSPMHLENLPELRAMFPDATYVVTYRDPVSVIQSAITMLAYGHRMTRKKVGIAQLAEYWPDRMERLLRRMVEHFAALPPDQRVDVHFHDFMADNAAVVRRVHHTAGLPETEQSQREIADFVEANPRGKHGQIVYDLEGDFGIDPSKLRTRFKFYFDAFGVQPEGDMS